MHGDRPHGVRWAQVLALLCCVCSARDAALPRLPETLDAQALDTYLEAEVRQRGRVGLSVTVVHEGRILLSRGYGYRQLAPNRPVDPTTMFGIGSISKQFTCAAILRLAEEGRLSIQDRVAKYYPQLTRATEISLLDLMHHVSGYRDYYPLDFVDRRLLAPISPDDLLRTYAGRPLDFDPGSQYSYSNTGYILLGRIVERITGQNLGEFLEERFFRPLEMQHTRYEPSRDDAHLALGYTSFALSEPEPAVPEAAGWLGGAGAIYSTSADLAKWNLALISGAVLQPASWELMRTPRQLSNGQVTTYGCGIGVRDQDRRQLIAHSGAVSGFHAYNAVIPSMRSGVSILCNTDGGLGNLATELVGLLLKDPERIPTVHGSTANEAARRMFLAFQSGDVARELLAEEFNYFLTPARLAGAAKRLKPFGAPLKAELISRNERGGLEVTAVRLTFRKGTLRTLMYRQPSGRVEQFFVERE